MFYEVVAFLSVLNLDVVAVFPLACVMPFDFHKELLSRTLVPLCLLGILLGLRQWCHVRLRRGTSKRLHTMADGCGVLAFYLVYLVYPQARRATLRCQCTPTECDGVFRSAAAKTGAAAG